MVVTFVVTGATLLSSFDNVESHQNKQEAKDRNTNCNPHCLSSPVLLIGWRFIIDSGLEICTKTSYINYIIL